MKKRPRQTEFSQLQSLPISAREASDGCLHYTTTTVISRQDCAQVSVHSARNSSAWRDRVQRRTC